jgi:hypothetical protein
MTSRKSRIREESSSMKTSIRSIAILALVLGTPSLSVAGDFHLDPGSLYMDDGGIGFLSSGLTIPVTLGATEAGASEEVDEWVWNYELTSALYFRLSGSYFDWRDENVPFDTGVFRLEDGLGVSGALGYRFWKIASFEVGGSWFPELFSKEDTGLPGNANDRDGGSVTAAILVHYPIWRFLPYVGGGGGGMELPEKAGTSFGPTTFVQGGLLFFIHEYVAISGDVKYHWGFIDDARDDTVEALIYSLGLQFNLPLGP